jgi:hypothetical protein
MRACLLGLVQFYMNAVLHCKEERALDVATPLLDRHALMHVLRGEQHVGPCSTLILDWLFVLLHTHGPLKACQCVCVCMCDSV